MILGVINKRSYSLIVYDVSILQVHNAFSMALGISICFNLLFPNIKFPKFAPNTAESTKLLLYVIKTGISQKLRENNTV